MPSSTVDTAAAVLRKAPVFAKVILVAWDPDSPAHTERMALQRVACGWKMEAIDKWRVLQREGKMTLQWVVSEDLVLSWICDTTSDVVEIENVTYMCIWLLTTKAGSFR